MRYLIKPAIAIFLLILKIMPAQNSQHHQLIEELIEELLVSDMSENDMNKIYDDLMFYLENPVNINTADADELAGLYFLDELQIHNLINYRHNYGKLMSIYELLYIRGFLPDDLRKITPFVTLFDPSRAHVISPFPDLRHGRHQLFLRFQQVLQQQKGFSPVSDSVLVRNPNSRYLGSPLKIYNRYQFDLGRRIQAGYVAEKDQGEEFFRGSNPYGFDYYSAHLQINDVGRFRTIALGDYQTAFGQGLVLSSGLSFGKSANVLNIRKNPQGIRKYSSTDENMFFRGAGITYRFTGNSEGSLFISRKKIDASISQTCSEGKILEVSSLRNTGLHATPSQIAGKNVLGETVLGGNITYNHELFKMGATLAATKYDALLNPPERVYNQFEFRGANNVTIGADYQFSLGTVRTFGEMAMSKSGGKALLAGATARLSPGMSISALYRNYSRDYHAYFSDGFRENTRTENERGFYLSSLLHLASGWRLSAYYDFFSFPWMRYGAYAPSSGSEYFVRLDFSYSRNTNMYLSFRQKNKPENSPAGDSHVRGLYDSGISRIRYHINYIVASSLELRNRLEFSLYNSEGIPSENGILLYQDILYKPGKMPLSVIFRYAVFETDSYNARFYAYENDVLYAFSIPAYYDRGYRTYILARYSAGDLLDIWVRFALTRLPDREVIGSGLNEIAGNTRSELKAQIRLRF